MSIWDLNQGRSELFHPCLEHGPPPFDLLRYARVSSHHQKVKV